MIGHGHGYLFDTCTLVYCLWYIYIRKTTRYIYSVYLCIYLVGTKQASLPLFCTPFQLLVPSSGALPTVSKPVCSSGLLASSSGALPDYCQDYGSHHGDNPFRNAGLSRHRPPEFPQSSLGSRPKPVRILPSPGGLQAGYCK